MLPHRAIFIELKKKKQTKTPNHQKTANVCKTSRPGTGKAKVNFFLPCSLLPWFVVWGPSPPRCYIQSFFFFASVTVHFFEAGSLGGLDEQGLDERALNSQ